MNRVTLCKPLQEVCKIILMCNEGRDLQLHAPDRCFDLKLFNTSRPHKWVQNCVLPSPISSTSSNKLVKMMQAFITPKKGSKRINSHSSCVFGAKNRFWDHGSCNALQTAPKGLWDHLDVSWGSRPATLRAGSLFRLINFSTPHDPISKCKIVSCLHRLCPQAPTS